MPDWRCQTVVLFLALNSLVGHATSPTVQQLLNAARAHNNEGRLTDSAALLRQTLRLQPDSSYAYANLGAVLKREGDYDAAEQMMRHGLRLAPTDANLGSNLAATLSSAKKPAEAVKVLEELLEFRKANRYHEFPEFRYNLALVQLQAGLSDQGCVLYCCC